MFSRDDPRSALAQPGNGAKAAPTAFAGMEYARFYELPPTQDEGGAQTWYARGQNFLVSYSEVAGGATFERVDQPDEYMVIFPDAETEVEIEWCGTREAGRGASIAIVPAGRSAVTLLTGGRIVRVFTTRSLDLAALCCNASSYRAPHPNLPTFEPWPAAAGGDHIRWHSLDVPANPGRFGRIFRCSTMMINVLEPMVGPRNIRELSPHHHDDFEQGSLVLEGSFTHHVRWPWTMNMDDWRPDDHEVCDAPSLAVIPPASIHTSQYTSKGVNLIADIFCPPRADFSAKPGWVLNADDYPAP